MSRDKRRVSTDGGEELVADNPFAALSLGPLPSAPPAAQRTAAGDQERPGPRGTLFLRRLKAGKGGKVVTEISGFGEGEPLRECLRFLQQKLAAGGAVKGPVLEVQGDRLEEVRPLLEERGYRVKGS